MKMKEEGIPTAVVCLFLVAVLAVCSYAQVDTRLQKAYTGTGYAICGSCTVPKDVSSAVRLAPKREPGEPIVLSGTIFKRDGVTPDSGITLFLYQADAGGYYHRPKEDVFHPRLCGWLRVGKDGRYEIHTVKPSPEVLAADEPAHIHAQIFGNGMSEHFLHDFWFAGDERIPEADGERFSRLGSFSPVITLTKGGDGILRGVRDIKVVPAPPWQTEPE